MKNVILYCRVSSDEQADGTSLDFQERTLRAYCKRNNYNIIHCCREDFSAKDHDFRRPEMKWLRDYCKKHKREVDMILFLRWDRFSRNPEFAHAFKRIFMDELGIEFNAIENPIDFEATEWSTLFSLYAGIAQTENNKISRRTKDGIRQTLLSGRCPNKAPIGYKNVHITDENGKTIAKYVEIDEKKAPLIKKIFNEVRKGIESPRYIRRRIAPQIPESTYFKILRNIFYKGKIRVPATKEEPEIIVDGQHQPLITEELFDRVQDIMDGKRKKQPKLTKPTHPEFYLRKFLVCPHCGRAITGATSTGGSGGKYPYYFCPTTGTHVRIKAEALNTSFVDYISNFRPNKAIKQLYTEILNDLRQENTREIRSKIENLDKEISKIKELIIKIEDKLINDEIDNSTYQRIIGRYENELKKLEDKKELLANPNRGEIKPQLKYSINLLDNIDNFFKHAPVEAKIQALSSIFPEKIEFDGKNFRTEKLNTVLALIYQKNNELQGNKKKNGESFSTFSTSVPPSRIELESTV